MNVNSIEGQGKVVEHNLKRLEPQDKHLKELKAMDAQPSDQKQRFDSYEPERPEQPVGIYEISHDEEGNMVVRFNKPSKDTAKSDNMKTPKEEPADEGEKPVIVKTTGNTDRVDREIEKLKQTVTRLEQKIASSDPEEKQSLETELYRLQAELKSKDNDTYRRQHMEITEQKAYQKND